MRAKIFHIDQLEPPKNVWIFVWFIDPKIKTLSRICCFGIVGDNNKITYSTKLGITREKFNQIDASLIYKWKILNY